MHLFVVARSAMITQPSAITVNCKVQVMAIRGSEDFGIIRDMERFFNIAGPCNPAKHYMLSATDRLPDVVSLIRKEQYFVIHA